ncbi:MAG TPA: ABC transporter permease [Thermoanaerobaculia bacterium]|jgi:putative ABC transport system permease protein|nr:ABC transporter permease [Thermoanaerobaculia bacterium]
METLRIAATALRAHKMRSFLTLLGVIIGVMTVVAVVSIISGLNNYISEKVFQLNPDVYGVTKFGIITSREQFLEAVKRKDLTWYDYKAVQERCGLCDMVGASHGTRAAVKRGAKKLAGVRTAGTTANMAELNNLDLEAGRFFTPTEERRSALVAVIGADVRDELFPGLDPIGRTIWIANQPMRVIGLLRKQGSVLGQSQDKVQYIPISTWRKRFGVRESIDIFVKAKNGVAGVDASMDDVRVILRSRRRTAFRDDDPFAAVTAEALQMLWKGISAGMFSLMILISSISLIVGGIVIMNIMLVSVVERTREIGVRRAIGATRRNIRGQFLTEAILLSLGGGIAGVILGVLISKSISTFSPMPTLVRPSLVLAGLLISVVTGVLAGVFPAVRASKLPPVEALRYE